MSIAHRLCHGFIDGAEQRKSNTPTHVGDTIANTTSFEQQNREFNQNQLANVTLVYYVVHKVVAKLPP